MLRLSLLILPLFILACANSKTASPSTTDTRPNMLVILLDDMGYSDMGCYGSEIATPNMDYLAEQGQRFSQYCTAPMCAPTRAMLLSGNDNHIEGMGRMMSVRGNHRNYLGRPHYEEDISERVVLFPKLLQKAGYYTSMSGKWHLGWDDSSDPYLHGFDDTWALRNSFANYYDSRNYGISDIKLRDTISMYTNNGKSVKYPVGQHATEVYTEKAITYFNTAKSLQKPFFTYLAYTAPHWPLQVEEKYCEPYLGQYDDGFRAVMQRRLKGLKEKGIITADTPLPAYPDVPKWDSLTESARKLLARKMELQAGLIAHLDEHIGKVIQSLKDNGQ
ncbi:MAG: sulfatase-like hydrolase/transferase, partial [Saprospiraceae bacterium]